MKSFAILVLCGLIGCYDSSRILGIFPVFSKSHFILGAKLMRELAMKGHEVTVISPYPRETPFKNYKDIPVEEVMAFQKPINFFNVSMGFFKMHDFMIKLGLNMTEVVFENPYVKNLLNSSAIFDVVIIDPLMNHALMGIAHHFGASLILCSSQPPNEWTKNFLRHPLPSTYIPSMYSESNYDMTTFQRIENMITYILYDIYDYFLVTPKHDKILEKYLPNSPTVSELGRNVDLVLYNSHISNTIASPIFPNMIEIGGFHVEAKRKPLPADIQTFLDNAVDGAIYFSMGSIVRSADFSVAARTAFLSVFSRLKQKVLWKLEGDVIEGAPENVKIGKWFPQQDVLAHPNVKVFITHCGLLSLTEAVYFGVPLLGIPIFTDQSRNCAIFKRRDIAQVLKHREINEDNVSAALGELLNNTKYLKNAKFASKVMRDQPMKPVDKAIFWIEYVLRNNGAKHLQAHTVHMPWYHYYMLDILITASIFIVIFALVCYTSLEKCNKYMAYHRKKLKTN